MSKKNNTHSPWLAWTKSALTKSLVTKVYKYSWGKELVHKICIRQIFQWLYEIPHMSEKYRIQGPGVKNVPIWFKNVPPGLWSSSWTTQSMWRMGRGISFLLFSKQILDFFSYNQILGFFFYFANADIRFLFLHFANSLTQLSYSLYIFTKK